MTLEATLLEVFVYWHADPTCTTDIEQAARRFQQDLRNAVPGLRAALFRRVEEDSGAVTWMEHYATDAGLPAADASRLLSESQRALGNWAVGGRHAECFQRLPG